MYSEGEVQSAKRTYAREVSPNKNVNVDNT